MVSLLIASDYSVRIIHGRTERYYLTDKILEIRDKYKKVLT